MELSIIPGYIHYSYLCVCLKTLLSYNEKSAITRWITCLDNIVQNGTSPMCDKAGTTYIRFITINNIYEFNNYNNIILLTRFSCETSPNILYRWICWKWKYRRWPITNIRKSTHVWTTCSIVRCRPFWKYQNNLI